MNQIANCRFKFFPQLNDLPQTKWLSSRTKLSSNVTNEFFNSNTLQDKLLRAIASERLLCVKEVFESFELFSRIRKPIRSRVVADLCCGHGLLGMLFGIFERSVKQVVLVDRCELPSRKRLVQIASQVAPWIDEKIDNRSEDIHGHLDLIGSECSVVSAHACGTLSDQCIDIAIQAGTPIAILPCCYPHMACQAPLSLQTALGIETAFDIDRTYRLETAGYRVRWGQIPPEITPMNRILYALPKGKQHEKNTND